jgi:hypothetical protein
MVPTMDGPSVAKDERLELDERVDAAFGHWCVEKHLIELS